MSNGGEVNFHRHRPIERARGRDLIVRAGPGSPPEDITLGGDLVFEAAGSLEVIRVKPDGTVMIRGERCAYNERLYRALCLCFPGHGGLAGPDIR